MTTIMRSKKGEAIAQALREAMKNGAKLAEISPNREIRVFEGSNEKSKCSINDAQIETSKEELTNSSSLDIENSNSQCPDYDKEESSKSISSTEEVKPVINNVKQKIEKIAKKQMRTPSFQRERSERKRVQKVVFDPSDLEPKKRKVVKKDGEKDDKKIVAIILCKACDESILGTKEEVSACEDCGQKVHRKCIKANDYLSTRWRCEDCKLCIVCRGKKGPKGEPLIQCAICSEAYHIKCINAKKVKSSQEWLCSTCSRVFPEDSDGKDESDSNESVKRESPEPLKQRVSQRRQSREAAKKEAKKETDDEKDDGEEEDIPDCSEWTPEQVHSYFMMYVPSQDAQVFLDQEIDGKSLLLLNRSDVLTRFDLKLGPALKVFALVKRLQQRSSDIELCWP